MSSSSSPVAVKSDQESRHGDTIVLDRDARDPSSAGGTSELSTCDEMALSGAADESRCGFIPGYSVLGTLGRGGMGVVYQAVQERLQRIVALKVLMPARAGNPEFVARFQREAMAVARLNHPNIVTAYDYGEIDNRFYLAIEYIEGWNCAELLGRRGQLSESEAVSIIRDAVLGLSHALSAGIIHRDVKPANLMLVSEAQRDASGGALSGMVKVTDLGLARINEQAVFDPDTARAGGGILGTPCYMAPEQARGEDVDFRCDIYGLGATLYHLLTGQIPFEAETPGEVIEAKHESRLLHPQDLAPKISDSVVHVIDRMMATTPEARYQTYEELLLDLQSVIVHRRPCTPSVPTELSSLERRTKRFRLPVARRGAATPLPFRLRMVTPPAEKEGTVRRLVRFAGPFLLGLALGLVL